ncbi:MAG: DsbA family protein [Propionibacteriaceae bacterium]
MSNPATDTPSTPAKPKLPWILVAILSVLVLALTMMLGLRTNEITKLRAERDTWQQAAGKGGSEPAATETKKPSTRISPAPTTGERAEAMKKLARRDPNDPLARGKVDAPIVMIEWADYRCPFCAKHALETANSFQPYLDAGSLRIEFRDLVLFGDESTLAAKAARAAGKQGKYHEYAAAIWQIHTGKGHPTFDDSQVRATAEKAGVPDMTLFLSDLNDPAIAAAVASDTAQAQELGINATPFFLVDTTPVSGALPIESFTQLLDDLGAKKK